MKMVMRAWLLDTGQWYFPVVRNRKETEISLLGVDEDGGEEGDERVDYEVDEDWWWWKAFSWSSLLTKLATKQQWRWAFVQVTQISLTRTLQSVNEVQDSPEFLPYIHALHTKLVAHNPDIREILHTNALCNVLLQPWHNGKTMPAQSLWGHDMAATASMALLWYVRLIKMSTIYKRWLPLGEQGTGAMVLGWNCILQNSIWTTGSSLRYVPLCQVNSWMRGHRN